MTSRPPDAAVRWPWTMRPDGLRLTLKVTPKAKRNAIGGVGVGAGVDGRPVLLVSVAAPPMEGAANDAVVALLADRLKLGRAAITVASGASGRHKLVDLAGNPERLAAALRATLETTQG